MTRYLNITCKDLKAARMAKGYSQTKLAALAGVARCTVSYWENKPGQLRCGGGLNLILKALGRFEGLTDNYARMGAGLYRPPTGSARQIAHPALPRNSLITLEFFHFDKHSNPQKRCIAFKEFAIFEPSKIITVKPFIQIAFQVIKVFARYFACKPR